MDELRDIFIHVEGQEQAAYVGGQEIARMTAMSKERFVTALFQWMRQHGARKIWIFGPDGQAKLDEVLLREIQSRNP